MQRAYRHTDSVLAGTLIEGSLPDGNLLDGVFTRHIIDAVIYFAASIRAGESVKSPMTFYENKVAGGLGLLQAMVHNNVRSIVFSSTAAVCRQQDDLGFLLRKHPQTTNQSIRPKQVDGSSVCCMLRDMATTSAIDAIALRYFNAAGSDPEGRVGERRWRQTSREHTSDIWMETFLN